MAQLRRFYTRVTDSVNAAVASPTVALLRVGATVVRDASSGNVTIGVRHPGALKQNDVCYVIRGGALINGLTLVLADAVWTYSSGNGDWEMEVGVVGGTYTPTAGDRLVLTGLAAGHKVSVYDNDLGAGSAGDPTVGSDGTVSGYVDAVDVDVKVTSGGSTTYITDVGVERREFVTPEEFGGDINTAVEYARFKDVREIRLTAAAYSVASTIKLYDGISIVGPGVDSCVITYTGSGACIESATKSSDRIYRCRLEGFSLGGPSKASGTVGIDALRLDQVVIRNVVIEDFDTGIKLDGTGFGCYRNLIEFCQPARNNTGIQVVNEANEQRIFACKIDLNTDYGIDVQGGNSVLVIGCNLESNGTGLRTASERTTMIGGRIEASTVRSWETTSAASYFTIMGEYRGSSGNGSYGMEPLDAGKFTYNIGLDRNAVRGLNLVPNGAFQRWGMGAAAAPDKWRLNNCTVARNTDAQYGSYGITVTPSSSSSPGIFQDVAIPTLWQGGGVEFVLVCRVKLGTSTEARLLAIPSATVGGSQTGTQLRMNRDTTTTAEPNAGEYVTASGWQTRYLVVRPGSTATSIRVFLAADSSGGTGTCLFGTVTLMPLGGPNAEYYEHIQDGRPDEFVQVDEITSGTGEDTLVTYTIAADSLVEGQALRVTAFGVVSGTAGVKTIRAKLGSTVIGYIEEAAGATDDWLIEWVIVPTGGATSQRNCIKSWQNIAIVATGFNPSVNTTENLASDVAVTITGECADAADAVTLHGFVVERIGAL